MGIATSQQLIRYYERYRAIDVTFTKEVIKATGLVTSQVFIKCLGETWPAVIYTSSFEGAKVIFNAKTALYDKIRRANNVVSLRYSFKESDKQDPFNFFVSGKATGFAPYGGSPDVSMMTMIFTQRPPDDLIEIMGRLLDANINSAKRREERILITPESMRKLKLISKETAIFVQGIPRRCILRDISFSGAKIIMAGVAKFLIEKETALRLDFDDPREFFALKGKIVRTEDVEGRKDLLALAICFTEQGIPMNYKLRINDFLTQGRESRVDQSAQEAAPAPADSAPAAAGSPAASGGAATPAGAKSEAAAAPVIPEQAPLEPLEEPDGAI